MASTRTGRETKGAVGEFFYLSFLKKLFSKKKLIYKLFFLQTVVGGSGFGRRQQRGLVGGGIGVRSTVAVGFGRRRRERFQRHQRERLR